MTPVARGTGSRSGPASFAERSAKARGGLGPLVAGFDPSKEILEAWELPDSADGVEHFDDIALEAADGSVGFIKPQSAFYERHGWRGARALQRLVADARSAGILVIVDAKRGDIGSTNQAYAEAYLGESAPYGADGLTVHPYLGLGAAMAPLIEAAHAAGSCLFVVTRSSNPDGRLVQAAQTEGDRTLEAALLAEIGNINRHLAPGDVGPVGAVVSPTQEVAGLDLEAARAMFLAPGLGAQGTTPADVAEAFSACPDRVLPAAARSLLSAGPDRVRLRDANLRLNEELSGLLP